MDIKKNIPFLAYLVFYFDRCQLSCETWPHL